ncbi:MAG TPA: CBS domain-containing protein [Atribacteraceae bacterium]|nr:CBS domain-containing protein [Atribacteraceae bacterium]
MTVEELMLTEIPVVNDFDSVQEVAEFLSRRKLEGACVLDLEQNLIGYFSLNEFFQKLVSDINAKSSSKRNFPKLLIKKIREIGDQEISDYMTEDFVSLTTVQDEYDLLDLFLTTNQELIPVMKDKRVVGILGKARFFEAVLKS